jgi:anti-sigma factor RsiW
MIMTNQRLEFAITQYLDGTLPAEDRAALERTLANDPEARRLLEEHRTLNDALKRTMPVPNVDFEQLSRTISAAVDRQQTAGPVDEQTELAITQYVHGELPAEEHAAIERRLENDLAARNLADDYRSLGRLVKQAMPMPKVNWDRLAEHLSDVVGEAAERARYSLLWVRRAARIAVAAVILVALGLGAMLLMNRGGGAGAVVRVIEVQGPSAEFAAGPAVAEITIGAMSDAAHASYSSAELAGELVSRLSITVAQPIRGGRDNSPF